MLRLNTRTRFEIGNRSRDLEYPVERTRREPRVPRLALEMRADDRERDLGRRVETVRGRHDLGRGHERARAKPTVSDRVGDEHGDHLGVRSRRHGRRRRGGRGGRRRSGARRGGRGGCGRRRPGRVDRPRVVVDHVVVVEGARARETGERAQRSDKACEEDEGAHLDSGEQHAGHPVDASFPEKCRAACGFARDRGFTTAHPTVNVRRQDLARLWSSPPRFATSPSQNVWRRTPAGTKAVPSRSNQKNVLPTKVA
mgnify:CR=1 FL=1